METSVSFFFVFFLLCASLLFGPSHRLALCYEPLCALLCMREVCHQCNQMQHRSNGKPRKWSTGRKAEHASGELYVLLNCLFFKCSPHHDERLRSGQTLSIHIIQFLLNDRNAEKIKSVDSNANKTRVVFVIYNVLAAVFIPKIGLFIMPCSLVLIVWPAAFFENNLVWWFKGRTNSIKVLTLGARTQSHLNTTQFRLLLLPAVV